MKLTDEPKSGISPACIELLYDNAALYEIFRQSLRRIEELESALKGARSILNSVA